MAATQVAFLCAHYSGESGETRCDWEVTGSDVTEVVRAAREHMRHAHGLRLSDADARLRLHVVRTPIHRRVRGV
jgi:predicted small metal-binding protein